MSGPNQHRMVLTVAERDQPREIDLDGDTGDPGAVTLTIYAPGRGAPDVPNVVLQLGPWDREALERALGMFRPRAGSAEVRR